MEVKINAICKMEDLLCQVVKMEIAAKGHRQDTLQVEDSLATHKEFHNLLQISDSVQGKC